MAACEPQLPGAPARMKPVYWRQAEKWGGGVQVAKSSRHSLVYKLVATGTHGPGFQPMLCFHSIFDTVSKPLQGSRLRRQRDGGTNMP